MFKIKLFIYTNKNLEKALEFDDFGVTKDEKLASKWANVFPVEIESKEEEIIQVTPERLREAYENEVSNQAIDHSFDFENVIKELKGIK